MTGAFPPALERLVTHLNALPGVGTKSAQRMAFHILGLSDEKADEFAAAISEAKHTIRRCSVCRNLSDGDVCAVCGSERRDHSVICVVETPKDLMAIERAREYNGLYHVLHGVISPLRKVSPSDIEIAALIQRVQRGGVDEVILATNPGAEGETTAMYIARLLKPYPLRVTRIAYGIPVGGNIDIADEATLSRAIEGRQGLE